MRRRPIPPVRMKDIARDLGISPMAVSKALRGHTDIGEETKERVLRRATELDYQVDWVARSMVTGRTYLIGLVVTDLMQTFFGEIAASLAEKLAPEGYQLLIVHTNENPREEEAHIRALNSRKVDGLVIASAQRSAAALKNINVPFVLVDRAIPGLEANFVGTPGEQIGIMATEHLIEQGCRRIAHITGPDLPASRSRLRGYRKALRRHDVALRADFEVDGGHDDAAGYGAMKRLLRCRPRVDGVFCFNDPVAVGAMRAVFEAGLRVPSDIAIIGAANMHYSDILCVPLSTIDQRTRDIGAEAARLLLTAMATPKASAVRTILLPPKLIVRASSLRRKPRSRGGT